MVNLPNTRIKGIHLAWVVVADLSKAIKFYTDTVGLTISEVNEEFGWAELQGLEGGARLGLAQMNPHSPIPPGYNAVLTMTVEDLNSEITHLKQSNVEFIGDIMEVPGVVKMQMVKDLDGNMFQIVQETKIQ